MAESCFLHFRDARWDELRGVLDAACRRTEPDEWVFPVSGEPVVFLYPYDDVLREYEDEHRDALISLLGGEPSATLCIQLRRSYRTAEAEANSLARRLFERFDGVFRDIHDGFRAGRDLD